MESLSIFVIYKIHGGRYLNQIVHKVMLLGQNVVVVMVNKFVEINESSFNCIDVLEKIHVCCKNQHFN